MAYDLPVAGPLAPVADLAAVFTVALRMGGQTAPVALAVYFTGEQLARSGPIDLHRIRVACQGCKWSGLVGCWHLCSKSEQGSVLFTFMFGIVFPNSNIDCCGDGNELIKGVVFPVNVRQLVLYLQ